MLWHSAAHVLGAALQDCFGNDALLCDGPPLREEHGGGGFFYELYLKGDRKVTDADFEDIMRAARFVPVLVTGI